MEGRGRRAAGVDDEISDDILKIIRKRLVVSYTYLYSIHGLGGLIIKEVNNFMSFNEMELGIRP